MFNATCGVVSDRLLKLTDPNKEQLSLSFSVENSKANSIYFILYQQSCDIPASVATSASDQNKTLAYLRDDYPLSNKSNFINILLENLIFLHLRKRIS